MDLSINIILKIFAFFLAVGAICGKALYTKQKLTKLDWFLIGCVFFTLALGVVKDWQSDRALKRSEEANNKLQKELHTEHKNQEKAQEDTIRYQSYLFKAMFLLNERIPRESDIAVLKLRGVEREIPISTDTKKPLALFDNDELEYVGFCTEGSAALGMSAVGIAGLGSDGYKVPSSVQLSLDTGYAQYPLTGEQGKYRIGGPTGKAMPVVVWNETKRTDCDIKFIVRSTDRARINSEFKPILDLFKEFKDATENKSDMGK